MQSMDADAPNMALFREALPRYTTCYEQLDLVGYVLGAAKELGLDIPEHDEQSRRCGHSKYNCSFLRAVFSCTDGLTLTLFSIHKIAMESYGY